MALIQLWGLRFQNDQDTLPLFTKIYGVLKERKLPFADESQVNPRAGLESKGHSSSQTH